MKINQELICRLIPENKENMEFNFSVSKNCLSVYKEPEDFKLKPKKLFDVNADSKEIIFEDDCDADIRQEVESCKDGILLMARIYLFAFGHGYQVGNFW